MNKVRIFVVLTLILALFSAGIGIAAAADPIVSIIPSQSTVCVGDDFDVYIQVDPNGNTLEMAQVDLAFDSSVVSLTVANGGMFSTLFSAGTQSGDMVTDISGLDPGVTATGNLAVLHMHANSAGTFTLALSGVTAGTATETLTPIVNDGTVTINVCGGAISATRDISDQTVEPGSQFTVTLTLTANEDNVQAPALDEDLPAGWTVTPMDNGGAEYKPSTTEWIWAGAMSSGDTKTVTYKVTVPASAALTDYYITGHASAYGVTPIAIGGESKVTVESGTTGDPISATRDISDQTVEPGSTFTVTLTLTANEDNVQAPALDENLPAGWTVTEMDNGGAEYKAATTEWIWAGAMSSGDTKTVTYKVTVPASAALTDYYITGHASAHDVDPIEIGGESKVTVRTAPPSAPPSPPSEVPILTSSGMCALIAVLGIVGAGIVNRGRRKS